MSLIKSALQTSVSNLPSDLDDKRRAHWLLSSYSDPVWTVTSDGNPKIRSTIDFRFTLADGVSLVDSDRLYATVKEYAWWVRDPRFSRIASAEWHRATVSIVMKLAHAMTIRKLRSFAHIQPYDLEEIIEDCVYGTDGVLHASERVGEYLQEQHEINSSDPKPYGGFPRYVAPNGIRSCSIDTKKILEACNLPFEAAMRMQRVSVQIVQAAKLNGFNINKNKSDIEIPPQKIQTVQSIRCWLEPFERLYSMGRQIQAETLRFKPFPYGSARIASVKGVASQRTPTPPPKLMIYLLEHSARWLFDHSLTLKDSPTDRNDIIRLATSCWIIIAAFTARRSGEIADLREGCLAGDDKSGWWLDIYIEKTLQRNDWIPVPVLVSRAVDTLSLISAEARLSTNSDNLFQWQDPHGEVIKLDVTKKLDDFAEIVQVPKRKLQNGTVSNWHWHPHQFRRFFAVLYFYRYENASIEVLSHHLRHFNLEMTKHYITQDTEVEALWADVEWDYTGHVARSIVAGERSVSGASGNKLKKFVSRLIKMFRQNLQIATPERLGASLKLVMQRQGLVLTPKPWVTCSCPRTSDAALKAACRKGTPSDLSQIGPDFARADPSVCCHRPHAITEGTHRPFIDEEVAHLDAVVSSGARSKTLFGDLESARVIELHHVRDTRYKAAEPLRTECIEEKLI